MFIFDVSGTLIERENDFAIFCEAVKIAVGDLFFRSHWSGYNEVTHSGAMKLASAGFNIPQERIFCSDEHPRRVDIIRSCRDVLFEENEFYYVGDGFWDLET